MTLKLLQDVAIHKEARNQKKSRNLSSLWMTNQNPEIPDLRKCKLLSMLTSQNLATLSILKIRKKWFWVKHYDLI